MAKGYDEIAGDVVQAAVNARALAIAGVDGINSQKELIDNLLSDEAIAETYKAVYKAIIQAVKTPVE